MAITLKHIAAACAFALAAAGLCVQASAAETHPKATKVLKEKAKSSKHKKAKKEDTKQDIADNEPEPDITDTTMAEYSCELNNKVTIYRNLMDDSHIALRWKNRLRLMDKVGTTTGAQRYENAKLGLVWIGIPSKGILLDSKQSRQLANECKDAEQARPPVVAAAPAEPKS
ncbi:hypothetical protein NX786_31535 [Telluria mixta]|uniref:C-type lysozyme inhibitor domain-containing protein n=1 Tax=Telluria mixta TaxID=34071 RepID=A0ABT2C8Z2_9BURK|nr:hypothetical protein [Telluria mixta]MCS0633879.1 hypothetical protein [Telluria mixta]WEM93240.1 hypothetical protein P0M04_17150 [Telluria mixta]